MRLETDIKLDFKDVLIRPKRSTLKSRSQVSLDRTYSFRNSKQTWTGVPVISANMDTTGTFEIAAAMAAQKCFTCLHKHYSPEEIIDFFNKNPTVAPLLRSVPVRPRKISTQFLLSWNTRTIKYPVSV